MLCPICNLDLTPLDTVSRTEHVNICIEGGPTTSLAFERDGHLLAPRANEPSKQRIICPVCSKTFQNVQNHFKLCAFKNDIPPHLLMEYWDKINSQLIVNNNKEQPKPFPREILDNFILKCMKEGRVGADVEYAQALSMSLAESETKKPKKKSKSNVWSVQLQHVQQQQSSINTSQVTVINDESSIQSTDRGSIDDESTPMITDQVVESQVTDVHVATCAKQSDPTSNPPSIILQPSSCVLNMMRNETTKKHMLNQANNILADTQTNILMSQQGNATTMLTLNHLRQTGTGEKIPKKKRRLELISDEDRSSNIQVRVERELAASKYWRRRKSHLVDERDVDFEFINEDLPDLWSKSRLSVCDIISCSSKNCEHDKIAFVLEEFRIYSIVLEKRQPSAAVDENTEELPDKDSESEVLNDFPSLSQDLLGLVNKQWMADLIIKSGYTNFYAHKLIWFTRTFKNNRPTTTMDGLPTIDLSDFSPDIIKHFLNFIYGSILPNIELEILEDLKSLSSRLGCRSMVDLINSSLSQRNSDSSQASQSISNLRVLSCPATSNKS